MGLVLVVVVAQQLSTAPEVSQRISRTLAKNLMFESFHYSAGLPRPSDFTCKHKTVTNPPCGKRRSRGAVDTELKTVKPEDVGIECVCV